MSPRHGRHPSSEEHILTGQESTEPGAVPSREDEALTATGWCGAPPRAGWALAECAEPIPSRPAHPGTGRARPHMTAR
ncbi:hypothetical protein E1211_11270 [Micromonospora sp. 15K316]|nr:hypothetical protein E1211_11270 [Micromonospora sp. 15K316]